MDTESFQEQMDADMDFTMDAEDLLMTLTDEEWLALAEKQPDDTDSPSVVTPPQQYTMTGTHQYFAVNVLMVGAGFDQASAVTTIFRLLVASMISLTH